MLRMPPNADDAGPLWRVIELPRFDDVRGNLIAVEGGLHSPFQIARVYYICDVPSDAERAGHAHKTLHQLFLAPTGSYCLHLDDGSRSARFTVDSPAVAVYCPPRVWRRIDGFSAGAVCLVLASDPFDAGDYLRSYDDFRRYVSDFARSPKEP